MYETWNKNLLSKGLYCLLQYFRDIEVVLLQFFGMCDFDTVYPLHNQSACSSEFRVDFRDINITSPSALKISSAKFSIICLNPKVYFLLQIPLNSVSKCQYRQIESIIQNSAKQPVHEHVWFELFLDIRFLYLHSHRCSVFQRCTVHLCYRGRGYWVFFKTAEKFLRGVAKFLLNNFSYFFVRTWFGLVLQLRKILEIGRWKHVFRGCYALTEFNVETVISFAKCVDVFGCEFVDILDVFGGKTKLVIYKNRKSHAKGAHITPKNLFFCSIVIKKVG